MALRSMFGRRADDTRVVDDRSAGQPDDQLDEDRNATEGRAANERTTDERAANERTTDERTANERTTDEQATEGRATDERATDERATEGRSRRDSDVTEPANTVPPATVPADTATTIAPDAQVRVRARTSIMATLALILGLSGLYAAMSGRLAPVGLVLSVFGALLAFGGLRSSRPAVADRRAIARAASGRRISTSAVAGGGLATFALVISLAGVVIAILALNHTSSWLDGDADQVSRARDWLNARWSWLERW